MSLLDALRNAVIYFITWIILLEFEPVECAGSALIVRVKEAGTLRSAVKSIRLGGR